MSTTIGQEATDNTGMTLGELRALVERADRLGLSDGAALKARVTMRGRIRSLTVEEPGAVTRESR